MFIIFFSYAESREMPLRRPNEFLILELPIVNTYLFLPQSVKMTGL